MSKEAMTKVRRILSFREHQRDRAGSEVIRTRGERDRADEAAKAKQREAEQELDGTRQSIGHPVTADDLLLAISTFQAVVDELTSRQEALKTAEQQLGQKTAQLLAVHRQVQQMETLLETLKSRRKAAAELKEQREMDDLAVVKESQQ